MDLARLEQAARAISHPDGTSSDSATRILWRKQIASLWAGYGKVEQCKVRIQSSKSTDVQMIRKRVDADAAADASVSHQRKLASYANELRFYQLVQRSLADPAGPASIPTLAATPHPLRTIPWVMPVPYFLDQPAPGAFEFVLSDLGETGFGLSADMLRKEEAMAALRWLAEFHRAFWESPHLVLPVAGEAMNTSSQWNLSDKGTYWHLPTRQEEHARLATTPKKSLSARLKLAAPALHELLAHSHCTSKTRPSTPVRRYRTLVHGDFKSENLLFDATRTTCAAYDFQYVGTGLGAQDIAYLLATSVETSLLPTAPPSLDAGGGSPRASANPLIAHYLAELGPGAPDAATFEVQLAVALADFTRFLLGWGTWGNWTWLTRYVGRWMDQVDGGSAMEGGEAAYRERLEQL
ncbi:hypothetical protein HDU96_008247, partial [Phlyctochytrium bullatum]